MNVEIDETGVLCVGADDGIDSNALKYWIKEYNEHGSKMIKVETKVKPRKTLEHDPHGNPRPY